MNCLELTQGIAKSLGDGWKLREGYEENTNEKMLKGPEGECLFLSLSWGPRGMLHISASNPDGIDYQTTQRALHVSNGSGLPSINVNLNKTVEQMTNDIKRRLLPEYEEKLVLIREQDKKDKDYTRRHEELKQQVCTLFGVEYRKDREQISSHGRIEVQVSGADSMRLYGHCMYITFDQLRRFKEAVPELFSKEVHKTL